MSTSLESALIDVRKAYRLLADYQQRLIELLAFIREEFKAVPYHQRFYHKVPRNFEGLEKSSNAGRRFLPLLDASIFWLRHAGQEDAIHFHRSGDLLIEVQLLSDDGGNVQTPAPPEESSSDLFFFFLVCDSPDKDKKNWYYDVWDNFEYPEIGEVVTEEHLLGYRGYCDAVSLVELKDKESVTEAINALRKRASAKLGIAI